MEAGENPRRGVLWVLLSALLWSTGGLGIKAIADPALKVAMYRSLVGGITLWLLFRPGRVRWTRWFVVAVISYAACLTTFCVSTRLTTAANAIFLQYSGVVWVLLFAPLATREPLRRQDVVAVFVALGGMALFFVGQFAANGMIGNVVAMISGAFFASLVIALRIERGASAEAAVTYGNALAALALLPYVATHDGLSLTLPSAAVLGLLGVFQIGLAYACFVRGLRSVSATQASLTGMLEPMANPVWVFLFLGERPASSAILGAVIVLAAIAWRTLQGTRPPVELPAPD